MYWLTCFCPKDFIKIAKQILAAVSINGQYLKLTENILNVKR